MISESIKGNPVTDDDFYFITSLYEKQLKLPDKKSSQLLLLCPVGLVGAGKTTVVQPMSERLSLVRISGDEIRILLKERGFNFVRTKEIGFYLIKKYLELGYSVSIDSDCVQHKNEIEQIVKLYAARIFWIHIAPPEEFILYKLRNLDKLKSDHPKLFESTEQAIENYLARKPFHNNLDFPFSYTFDTSLENLPRQIDEAIELMKKTEV